MLKNCLLGYGPYTQYIVQAKRQLKHFNWIKISI